MCNLYSQTLPREAVRELFKVSSNRAASINSRSAIFPGNDAPVVRLAEDGDRELVELSWGFILLMKDRAPKRVTNFRDDKIDSRFWNASFRGRRCLIPATSFAEPKGKRPATWHWFALDKKRPLFAFAGIWRAYSGPLKKDCEKVDIDTYSIMTTKPNKLVAQVHPQRMPVILTEADEYETWLNGTPVEARTLVRSYPADKMEIVQSGAERKDLMTA